MLSKLNDKQKEVVEQGDGPILIVAGAGSGKTKTLTARLAYLIANNKVSPKNILAITFTNKAAEQMKSRVNKELAKFYNIKIDAKNYPFVGTFHSFGAKVLRENPKYFNRTKAFSIYDRNDSIKIAKEILGNPNQKEKVKKKDIAILLNKISKIKSELLGEVDINESRNSKLWNNFLKYEEKLQENNAFDFDDLIEKPVKLFSENEEMLSKYRDKYRYVLVDEFQDVNTAQYQLIKLLAEKHRNINVVGDDQQSIYKFRFSDFRNFLNFDKDWPDAKIFLLEQNYRSTKNIVETSSDLISRNSMQKRKKLWTENNAGNPVEVISHNNEYDQADFVAEKVRDYLENKKSIGILFRTNAQSRALEQILINSGIEYSIFGALSFYDRKEIKDMTAILRVALNPKDKVSIERIEKVFYKKKTAKLLEELPKKSELKPFDLIKWIVEYTEYIPYLEKNFLNYDERIENIAELIYFSKQFDNLHDFLEKITLTNPLDWNKKSKRKKRDFSGLNLMTMHLSKGLEFDVVFVVGVNEGLCPHQRSLFSSEEIEEERRLMYVAMTRAREELILSFYDMPSRFLSELPGDKVRFQNQNIDSSPSIYDEDDEISKRGYLIEYD